MARVIRLWDDNRLIDTHSALEAGGAHYERFYDALADRIEELESMVRILQKENADFEGV